MGFGVLFFGYALLLNIARFDYTDLIASLILLMGLVKLFPIHPWFKRAAVATGAFSLVGLAEIVLFVLELFGRQMTDFLGAWYLVVPRHIALAALTVCILLGIRGVAQEVGLPKLVSRCESSLPLCIVYVLAIALEIPALSENVEPRILATVASVLILFELFMLIRNLITIYQAYMRICMPGDQDMKCKPSRFRFINEMRERREEKEREDQAYRLSRMKEKTNRKKRK